MASFAAVRTVLRSTSARQGAARLAGHAKPKPSPSSPRASSNSKSCLSNRTFRCPVQTSFCVESMMPYHTATASALMTSMLSVSPRCYGWLTEVLSELRSVPDPDHLAK